MNKQKILIISLIILLIFSVSYFVWDISLKIRNSIAFQGYLVAINQLIDTAEKSNCQSFPVILEEKTVHLINIECLQQVEDFQLEE